ncbi:protein of unknown function DUF447 [Ancylobacter novellus DSM 506]|uniref:DUF447 domain-containing protein n=1 Tax=Ancylobacter novellus (strain ATCC 8093 / DSM 506 / JCM 20403 / CCM 1077 / IAM 12100 / NBRC 12443 / NCIMB 10456) TaxID=639283 RepID=D7A5G9_ANCN5|nr:DUF447 domain-containing protein [Ancylobacter novellus]ADH88093.1 protein of unknown function DUF447 [Ancylobacter novellus DSM 506]
MIRETIVTTRSPEGVPHIAPMGATVIEGGYLLQPFRPSRTLDNLASTRIAVVNFTDDVRIFAACVIGRKLNVDVTPATRIKCPRLLGALAHDEIVVDRIEDDPQRPRFFCRTHFGEAHHRFEGLNRAKAAVLEAAVLVSRLSMLPDDKVDQEMAYHAIAVEKTAGPEELEAWGWMVEAVAEHRRKRAS